jgi:hypothetical protein
MTHPHCEGPIKGLCLPLFAWTALDEENIGTIDQLRATAAQPEWCDRMGSETTQVIRVELDRVIPGGWWPYSPWSA